ncbi:hypothetical protein DER46DRAFT_619803 [Fusarium sp. MPI-SDFR-AT-0072]|nr:hypothetical protein DER46DRAFT_619803 [Fusarium sp. MPI-SDFR-AT-0072]
MPTLKRPFTELPYLTLAIAASIQSSPRTFSITLVSCPMADYSPQKPNQAQQEQWSNYDLLIEVTTLGQLPVYRTAVYDPYGPKIEVNDPSM